MSSRPATPEGPRPHRDGDRVYHAVLDHPGAGDADRRPADERRDGRAERRQGRTQAINARAEPILRAEALKAGSANIDVVAGAKYTSQS